MRVAGRGGEIKTHTKGKGYRKGHRPGEGEGYGHIQKEIQNTKTYTQRKIDRDRQTDRQTKRNRDRHRETGNKERKHWNFTKTLDKLNYSCPGSIYFGLATLCLSTESNLNCSPKQSSSVHVQNSPSSMSGNRPCISSYLSHFSRCHFFFYFYSTLITLMFCTNRGMCP